MKLSLRAVIGTLLWLLPPTLLAAAAPDSPPAERSTLSAGLELFLEARLLDSAGRLDEAAEAYEEALELEPDSTEIRVRYASLLMDLGDRGRDAELVDRAYALVAELEDMDWYGRRVRALALADKAARQPEFLEQAAEALESVVEERPDDPNLTLSLAQVFHRLNRLDRAAELVGEMLDARGGSPQLVAYHAGLLRALNRLDEAAEAYEGCVNSPYMAEVCRQARLELLLELGRSGEAGEELLGWAEEDDLDQLVRAAAMLYEGGRPEQALGVVQRVLTKVPDSPRARSLEAMLLSALGREQEAAARFRDLLRKDRENLDLLLPLAWSLARAGQHEEARTVIGRAWELVQHDAGSARAAGVCLAAARVELEAGKPLLARDWLRRVADPAAASPDLIRLLAESYRQSEQYGEGVPAMIRLQAELPDELKWEAVAFEAEFRLRAGRRNGMETLRPLLDSDELARVGMGIQILQALERWADVVEETGRALESFPDSVPLLFARAVSLERTEQLEQAAAVFESILELEPRNAAVANYLGYMWADKGVQLERALQLIGMAVEQEPENSAYLDSLGWVHYRLGNLEEARHWLQRAVELGGADGTVLGHLGEVLLKSGEVEQARRLLQQSLALGGEDAERVRDLLDGISGERD